jgi:parallel beta-helix repeat protein
VSSRKLGLRLTLGTIMTLVTLLGLGCASSRSHHGPRHLYVSARGSDRARCTQSKPCRSITRAVTIARAGEEIDVARGSYPGEVVLTKRLTIRGSHSPVVDARGHGRGFFIRGKTAAGSVVRGFVVQNASYEGILALGTARVTIADDVVRHNDRGLFVSGAVVENTSYERIPHLGAPRVTFADYVVRHDRFNHHLTGECKYNGEPPPAQSADLRSGQPRGAQLVDLRGGGCGEAIHLASTSHSRVLGNQVSENTGGIYLTDESGPAAHNLIAGNRVFDNVWDCAITLASHSQRAVKPDGQPRPRAGGVYDNTIKANVTDGNGVRLPGAGILVAAAFSGGAAYSNRIIDNKVNDNGLPGVALHSHKRRQDLNGNVIRDNVIGRNAVGGAHGGPGDEDGGIHHTAGILAWSKLTRITRIQVSGNHISQNYFGVWTKNVPRLQRAANHYVQVRVPLSQH